MEIFSLVKKNILFLISLVFVFLISVISSLYFFSLTHKSPFNVENLPTISTPTKVPKVITSLVLTGDVMLGRNVMNESVKNNNFTYPFLKVSDCLKASDIVFINLENPVIDACPKIDSGFTFCSLPQSLDGLLYAGVDIVSLANNHTQNFGKDGFEKTEKSINAKGILTTSVNDLTIKHLNGLSFGFLGFDFTVHEPTLNDYQLIKSSDPKVDILIVAVHWGVEYEDKPRDFQREWARLMVMSGADIIAGNHPHWVQGAECFENGESISYTKAEELEQFSCMNGKKAVYYALGNFVFDQMWSEETKKGVIVKLTFQDTKVVGQEIVRTYIRSIGQPEFR